MSEGSEWYQMVLNEWVAPYIIQSDVPYSPNQFLTLVFFAPSYSKTALVLGRWYADFFPQLSFSFSMYNSASKYKREFSLHHNSYVLTLPYVLRSDAYILCYWHLLMHDNHSSNFVINEFVLFFICISSSAAGRWKTLGVPVVIGGDNLPSAPPPGSGTTE